MASRVKTPFGKLGHAKVTTVDPLTITPQGSTTPIGANYNGSYSPTVGDSVAFMRYRGRQIYVFGTEVLP